MIYSVFADIIKNLLDEAPEVKKCEKRKFKDKRWAIYSWCNFPCLNYQQSRLFVFIDLSLIQVSLFTSESPVGKPLNGSCLVIALPKCQVPCKGSCQLVIVANTSLWFQWRDQVLLWHFSTNIEQLADHYKVHEEAETKKISEEEKLHDPRAPGKLTSLSHTGQLKQRRKRRVIRGKLLFCLGIKLC